MLGFLVSRWKAFERNRSYRKKAETSLPQSEQFRTEESISVQNIFSLISDNPSFCIIKPK